MQKIEINKGNKMNILKLAFIVSLFTMSSFIFAGETKFFNDVYKSCIVNQNAGELNKKLRAVVIQDFCNCYSLKATKKLFGNKEFITVNNKNDEASMLRLSSKIINSDVVSGFSNGCLSDLELKHGGSKNLYNDVSAANLSKIVGLVGEDKRSFLMGGIDQCITNSGKLSSSSAKNYCTCAMNYLAGKLSPNDVFELGIDKKSAFDKVKILNNQALKKCSKHIK